ncbi:hypothetical protein Taro_003982 [Colocasia esculenta]|uniref:Uncharacterized protein n=1 Tax=Colocasia esculenta TaxID=4460 RepID=A0A843TQE5_COLES|nr:hypothetical protein [Colocasia esculenta]
MDVGAGKPDNARKASETFPVVVGGRGGGGKRGEDGEGESISLLASGGGGKGSLATGRRQRSTKRKVRWNDRHGSSLVEVLEFQPSSARDDPEDPVGSMFGITMCCVDLSYPCATPD